jgi:hypothetical protein
LNGVGGTVLESPIPGKSGSRAWSISNLFPAKDFDKAGHSEYKARRFAAIGNFCRFIECNGNTAQMTRPATRIAKF